LSDNNGIVLEEYDPNKFVLLDTENNNHFAGFYTISAYAISMELLSPITKVASRREYP